MATITDSIDINGFQTDQNPWIAGGIAGFFAGSLFGAMMSATTMMENVAALVGQEHVAVGWIVHFSISILVAMLYVGIVSTDQLDRYATQPSTGAGLGIVYGILLWTAGVVFIMPLWLDIVTPATPLVPNLDWMSFVGHLIYGVSLGTLYPLLLTYGQPSLEVLANEFETDDGTRGDDGLPAVGPGLAAERTEPTDVFSAATIRNRLANNDIPLAIVLASTAIERILVDAITAEADIASDQVDEFCRGTDLDRYIHTASILGLFEDHIPVLETVAEHRTTMVQRSPEAVRDAIDGDATERQAILDAAAFIEDVGS